jgi:hypothetical protein
MITSLSLLIDLLFDRPATAAGRRHGLARAGLAPAELSRPGRPEKRIQAGQFLPAGH